LGDSVTDFVDVRWDAVPAGALAQPGTFTVRGRLAGYGLATSLAVTVSDAYLPGRNLAPHASPSASFSGTPQTVPAALNNGVQPETDGWFVPRPTGR
jgi:Big-like domain-containing protein